MVKKLTKHGNSLALVIDRGILDLLHIEEDTPLDITTDGRVLVVSPIADAKRRKQFEEAMKKSHRKFGRMYKRLANMKDAA